MAKQLSYGPVEIYAEEVLGRGAYGKVCRAKCGYLPCAAKLLHETLLDAQNQGAHNIVQRFEQECQFLSSIKHPNIVQYLRTVRYENSGQLALFMELMEESLTKFLERQTNPLDYCSEVDLCSDIVLAVVFLHENQIIHRDLSSNNILLTAGQRAKIADFGMSRLVPKSAPLTQVPGTTVYMSPEALLNPPKYTEKLDCFSYGVLVLQILTRKFPSPGDAMMRLKDHLVRLVPERDRRKNDIDLIDFHHPLKQQMLACLGDRDADRPTAAKLCKEMSSLKEERKYSDKRKQPREREREVDKEMNESYLLLAQQQELQEFRKRNQILETELAESRERDMQRERRLSQDQSTERELRGRLQQEVTWNQDLERKCHGLERDNADLRRELALQNENLERELHKNYLVLERERDEMREHLRGQDQQAREMHIARERQARAEYQRAMEAKDEEIQLMKEQARAYEKIVSDTKKMNLNVPTRLPIPKRRIAYVPRPPPFERAQSQPLVYPPVERAHPQMFDPSLLQAFNPLAAQAPPFNPLPVKRAHPHPPSAQAPSFNPPPVAPPKPQTPIWVRGQGAMEDLTCFRGQVTVHDDHAYFSQDYAVYSYNETHDKWVELPRCTYEQFGIAVVKNRVTSIGGSNRETKFTNKVLTLVGSGRGNKHWEEVLQAMPTARINAAVVTTARYMVVAGGSYVTQDGKKIGYDSVEVLNLDTNRWSVSYPLRKPVRHPQLVINNTELLFLADIERNEVYEGSMDKLVQYGLAGVVENVWIKMANLPVVQGASLACLDKQVFAIGGLEAEDKALDTIYRYNRDEDSWELVKRMPTGRSWVMSVVYPRKGTLVVVGGYINFRPHWSLCNIMEKIVMKL